MVDQSTANMDSHHGPGPVLLDTVHVPMVPSPSSAKMNGGVHHRHSLNVTALSTSSKHSSAGNGLLIAEPKGGCSLPLSPDHHHSRIEIPQDPINLQRRNLSQLRFYCRDRHLPELLGSLALLAVVSILLAFLAIVFFLKITPLKQLETKTGNDRERPFTASEYFSVYEVVLGLVTCTISLDFCCFLICAVQFLFAAKLLKISQGDERAKKYLQRGACSRGVAICGFFISIPIFLTGIILYAFVQFHLMSAITTGALLGVGIIFSGVAVIHNVYLWQVEQVKCSSSDKDDLRNYPNSDNGRNTSLNTSQVPYMELSTLV